MRDWPLTTTWAGACSSRISPTRAVRNALDRARLRQASRLFADRERALSPADLSTIEPRHLGQQAVSGSRCCDRCTPKKTQKHRDSMIELEVALAANLADAHPRCATRADRHLERDGASLRSHWRHCAQGMLAHAHGWADSHNCKASNKSGWTCWPTIACARPWLLAPCGGLGQ